MHLVLQLIASVPIASVPMYCMCINRKLGWTNSTKGSKEELLTGYSNCRVHKPNLILSSDLEPH